MPELPEVEVLARHLGPLLKGRTVTKVRVRRARVIAPTPERELARALEGAAFTELKRRGKYLLFELDARRRQERLLLLGHLGMTGRMYVARSGDAIPKHAAVVLELVGNESLIFEDTRYFGRLTLDTRAIDRLGPEPLGTEFTPETLAAGLARSARAIKVKLLDQSLVAGLGNIYDCEALFAAKISPRLAAGKLSKRRVERLWRAIRDTLERAIALGAGLPLDFSGVGKRDGLFYYGTTSVAKAGCDERFLVYDREGEPCVQCGSPIRRITQAARSTYFCAHCQR